MPDSDAPPPPPSSPPDRAPRRPDRWPSPGTLGLATVACMAASTTAFAVGRQVIGAVLGVGAGLASAAMAWSWIRRN